MQGQLHISHLSPLFGCGNAHLITHEKKLGFKELCKGLYNIKKFQSFQDIVAHGSCDHSLIHCKLYIFVNDNKFNKYIQVLHIGSLYVKMIVGVSRDAMKQL